ncbi:MAG: hypothetical protein ACYDA9_18895 [Terriglobia bacterium]
MCAILLLFFGGAELRAQSSTPAQQPAEGPAPYGTGQQEPLEYSEHIVPRNILLFDLAEETAYDDNVLSNNANRRSDVSFGLSPRLAFLQQRQRTKLALDYQPTLVLYKDNSGYNAANQSVQFDGEFEASPRLELRLRDGARYSTGLFEPVAGEALGPALGSPATLNQSVYAPLTREFENNSRLDLKYKTSRETSITFFGGASERHFGHTGNQSGNLLNTDEESAGAEFIDRVTRTMTLGAFYLFQNMSFGNVTRSVVHSAYLSLTKETMHGFTFQISGGPQYARIRDRVVVSLLPGLAVTLNSIETKWHGAYQGTITHTTDKTALEISAQRSVQDGGGLLATVMNTDFSGGIKRELIRHWAGVFEVDAARSQALGAAFAGSRLDSQSAGVAIEHAFTENLTGRLAYNFIRQRGTGQLPFLPDLDRNRVSFTISYQFRRKVL